MTKKIRNKFRECVLMGKVLIEYLGEPNDLNSTTFEGII